MSWTLKFTDASGANPQTVNLEALGALEGGEVTGQGIKFTFNSHAASEVAIKIPNVNPAQVPKIPFLSKVTIKDGNGVIQFVGRRIDLEGSAGPNAQEFSYQFQDAWFDLGKITFKSVWWSGAYQAVTTAGSIVTLGNPAIFVGALPQANFYTFNPATKVFTLIGAGWNITPGPSSPTSTITAAGGTGTLAGATFMSFFQYYTDAVLFQFRPGDPYQNASQILEYYITNGAQIIEILNFAIAQGVNLQVGQIDPALFVPWYPVRCVNCADAIKICLRMNPDCYSEIDYATTPPTFNVRARANLTALLLPYASTDSSGKRHLTTDIKPRPDLVPTRIGIFYRYLVNGSVINYPIDIYPVNAPDGILAMDYSLDLQGPNMSISSGEVDSVPFDKTSLAFWKQKHPDLGMANVSGLAAADAQGGTVTPTFTVLDDAGNPINTSVFAWEFIGGAKALWMLNIEVIEATVSGFFNYTVNDANTNPIHVKNPHPKSCRIRLTNTSTIFQTFVQALTTGEALPVGLAQSIYTSLQQLQYNLTHKLKETPFTSFIKPGKHAVNLSGGNPAWATMAATVQSTEYVLYQDGQGKTLALSTIKCGPVAHLEAGELVQLFNLFANRDLNKINPWERITGTTSQSQTGSPTVSTPKENSTEGVPNSILHTASAAFTPRT